MGHFEYKLPPIPWVTWKSEKKKLRMYRSDKRKNFNTSILAKKVMQCIT
jgi:hypothetical protein